MLLDVIVCSNIVLEQPIASNEMGEWGGCVGGRSSCLWSGACRKRAAAAAGSATRDVNLCFLSSILLLLLLPLKLQHFLSGFETRWDVSKCPYVVKTLSVSRLQETVAVYSKVGEVRGTLEHWSAFRYPFLTRGEAISMKHHNCICILVLVIGHENRVFSAWHYTFIRDLLSLPYCFDIIS